MLRVLVSVSIGLLALVSLGCGHPASMAQVPLSQNQFISSGTASFYNEGGLTSSGENFNPNDLTAAHRYLPFGTRVTVRNESNGKSVVVRVNDRGPFLFPDRIMDLSEAAAAALDMIGPGTATVTLSTSDRLEPAYFQADKFFELWSVQLAAYSNVSNAEAKKTQMGESAFIRTAEVNGRIVYRLFYGMYRSRPDARSVAENMKRGEFPSAIAKYLVDEHFDLARRVISGEPQRSVLASAHRQSF